MCTSKLRNLVFWKDRIARTIVDRLSTCFRLFKQNTDMVTHETFLDLLTLVAIGRL